MASDSVQCISTSACTCPCQRMASPDVTNERLSHGFTIQLYLKYVESPRLCTVPHSHRLCIQASVLLQFKCSIQLKANERNEKRAEDDSTTFI